MKKRKRKKTKGTRHKTVSINLLLVELIQYLLDDNIALKQRLISHRKHEGKTFGGASHFSRSHP
tara:strand:- start:162 stop:353 length:192 start_codon:yes stop_codon:yes gene_type:complete